jgi:hypothetical protein
MSKSGIGDLSRRTGAQGELPLSNEIGHRCHIPKNWKIFRSTAAGILGSCTPRNRLRAQVRHRSHIGDTSHRIGKLFETLQRNLGYFTHRIRLRAQVRHRSHIGDTSRRIGKSFEALQREFGIVCPRDSASCSSQTSVAHR